MHRVELKVGIFTPKVFLIISVPNAPCGVESLVGSGGSINSSVWVPNAPCGVESIENHIDFLILTLFLMHRVELKASSKGTKTASPSALFLMHRVELKVKHHHLFQQLL